MKCRTWLCPTVLVLALIAPFALFAQTGSSVPASKPDAQKPPASFSKISKLSQIGRTREQRDFIRSAQKWIREPWTGDDTPYLRINAQIDAQLAGGARWADLAKQYHDIAKAKPYDLQAQYRWIYCLLEADVSNRCVSCFFGSDRPAMLKAMTTMPSPRTYSYARLRYMVAGPASGTFEPMGERLIQHAPHDKVVKRRLATEYCESDGLPNAPAHFARGVKLAKELVAEYPKDMRMWFTLGFACDGAWRIGNFKDPELIRTAIAAYRNVTALPPYDDWTDIARVKIPQLIRDANYYHVKL